MHQEYVNSENIYWPTVNNMLMANESDYSEVLLRAMYPAWIRPTDMEIITTDQPPDSK